MDSEDDNSTSSEQEINNNQAKAHSRSDTRSSGGGHSVDTSSYNAGAVNYRTWLAKKRREKQLKEIVEGKPTRKSGRPKRPLPTKAPKSKKRKLVHDEPVEDEHDSQAVEDLDDSEDEARTHAAEALEELRQLENEEKLREQKVQEAIAEEANRTKMALSDIVWNGLTGVAEITDSMMGYDGSFGKHIAKNQPLREITNEWTKSQNITKKTVNKYAGWGIAGIVLLEYMNYRGISFDLFTRQQQDVTEEPSEST